MIDMITKKQRKFSCMHPAMVGLKLNAGCGTTPREGFIGIDLYDYGQDIVWDLEDGVPLPDDSCVEIITQHTLEHIPDMIGVMCEFWRVLEPNGKLTVIVPYKTNRKALIPTHVRLCDEETFRFFEEGKPLNEARRHSPEKWKIEEMIVNDRPDLVVIMRPIKS
jgi:SAM-dependent methyltransferase